MKKTMQNVLILLGCYWLSMWVVVPIVILHSKLTSGIIYSGPFGAILMNIVVAIPEAIVAAGAGMLCVFTLEGAKRNKWLLLLSLFYAILRFTSFHWAQEPGITDLLLQGVESSIPALTCYLGGTIVYRKLQKIRTKI